jgi:hypothetical protein
MTESEIIIVPEEYPDEQPEIDDIEEIDADNIIIDGDYAVFRMGYNEITRIPLVDLGTIENVGA